MLDNDRVLSNIYGETLYYKLDWSFVSSTRTDRGIINKYSARIKLTDNKYVSLILVYNRNKNTVYLSGMLNTKKSVIQIFQFNGFDYSILYDILYFIETDINY
jgi:hypothetical protein